MTTKIHMIAVCLLMASGLFAQRLINQRPAPSDVVVQRLGDHINTTASDFAPARYVDRIYFTTMYRDESKGTTYSRIHSFQDGGDKARLEEKLAMNQKSVHIANIAFMPDASRMYFTICKDEDQANCEIWYRNRQYDGIWGVAQRLPDFINQRGSTTTQPSIGWDESQKKFALFFVSDRKGGRGGKDIWVSHITWDGNYETPYALRINTPGDDVSPFFHRASQTLYFSSNGLEGIGRFDIYKAAKKGDMFVNPVNLGRPYNSAYDDLYFTLHDQSQTGYFSSDRPGSVCSGGNIDGWNCYDLYQVSLNKESYSGVNHSAWYTDEYEATLKDQ